MDPWYTRPWYTRPSPVLTERCDACGGRYEDGGTEEVHLEFERHGRTIRVAHRYCPECKRTEG